MSTVDKEEIKQENIEKKAEQREALRARTNLLFRYAGAGVFAALIIWYFAHGEYYAGERFYSAFRIRRSWLMLLAVTGMITLCVTPNRLSDRLNRILSWIWLVVSPLAVYFSLYYMNAKKYNIKFGQLNQIAVVFTFWFLYLLVVFFFLITGSIKASVISMALLIGILGIANRFIIMFRGTALSGADIFSLQTATTVAANYTYKIIWDIFAEIFLTLIICTITLKLRSFRAIHWKQRTALLVVWITLAGLFYHICCRTSYLEDHDIRSWGFTHQLRYKQYDMLFTTLVTCFYLAADKPEGYSLDRVQEIAEPYIEKERMLGDGTEGLRSEDIPNIIVIMNESFADYADVGQGLEFTSDPMEFIHGLTKNTIKGTAYASIFGANTPNSEYEFLTGNTMGFLPPTSVGFNLFVRGNMPSLASELLSEGYRTLAIHPYRGTNYRRNVVYPQIGFESYYDRRYFLNPQYMRQYISDQTLAERIISEYKKNNIRGDQKLFSYNVTVQNHGGYTSTNIENLPNDILVLTPGINILEARQHANLIKASDDAFKYLVEYFEQQDEKTVILMFGDHQANIGDDTYEYLIGNEEELTAEELMEKYKIPFVCWANYDIPEETIEKTSLNYLYSILADRLNLPMTGYQRYLLDLSEEIPVLAAGGYWASDGSFYELRDKKSPYFERINEYHTLEYNYIFGKNHRAMDLFALPEKTE